MSDLIDKLNLLLRANLENFANRGGEASPTPQRLPPERLGKDVDREIAALRRQIDAALNKEEDLKQRLEGLRGQVEQFDRAADAALERGDESAARANVQQMQASRKRVTALEAELGRHRDATFDLIQHVNTLEAMVSDARHAQAAETASTPAQTPAAAPAPPSTSQAGSQPPSASPSAPLPGKTATELLSDMLRSVRERVEDAVTARPVSDSPESEAGQPDVSRQGTPPARTAPAARTEADAEVDEDLARRRARLS